MARAGLSRVDTIILVATVVAVGLITLAGLRQIQRQSARVDCENNLRQIAVVFGPTTSPNEALRLAEAGRVAPAFQARGKQLTTPGALRCPQDRFRTRPAVFTHGFDDNAISYFLGLDVNDVHPRALLAGDRNLEAGGLPVAPGFVTVTTNQVLGWTRALHNRRGNLALADGSVQGLTSVGLQEAATQSGLATNRFAVP